MRRKGDPVKVLGPRNSAIRHVKVGDECRIHGSKMYIGPTQRWSCEVEHINSSAGGGLEGFLQRRGSQGLGSEKESFWQMRYRTLSSGSLTCLKQAETTVASERMCWVHGHVATQHDMATPLSCGHSTTQPVEEDDGAWGRSCSELDPYIWTICSFQLWRAQGVPSIGWILGLKSPLDLNQSC